MGPKVRKVALLEIPVDPAEALLVLLDAGGHLLLVLFHLTEDR